MNEGPIDVAKRDEYKVSLVPFGVGKSEHRGVDNGLTHSQEVNIDNPRSPSKFFGTISSKSTLNTQYPLHHLKR